MTTNARAPGARSGDVRHRLFLFVILMIAIILSCNPIFAAEQVGSNAIAPRKLAIGVFVNDPKLGGAWDPPAMDNFARMVGVKPSAWHWYAPFGAPFKGQPFNAAASRGYMPVLSWGASDANNSPISWDRVAAAAVDNLIRKFARSAAAWRKPLYLRPQWETNLSFDGRGNTPGSFVRMWKRMHNIFVQEGAVNVRWIWNPAEEGEAPKTPYASYYPGDAYVDYIGFDAYNCGTARSAWPSAPSTARIAWDRSGPPSRNGILHQTRS